MKKKLIIGALAISSVLAYAQTTGDNNQPTESIFWGTACHSEQTGARSSTICCYYVFWINTGCHEAG